MSLLPWSVYIDQTQHDEYWPVGRTTLMISILWHQRYYMRQHLANVCCVRNWKIRQHSSKSRPREKPWSRSSSINGPRLMDVHGNHRLTSVVWSNRKDAVAQKATQKKVSSTFLLQALVERCEDVRCMTVSQNKGRIKRSWPVKRQRTLSYQTWVIAEK